MTKFPEEKKLRRILFLNKPKIAIHNHKGVVVWLKVDDDVCLSLNLDCAKGAVQICKLDGVLLGRKVQWSRTFSAKTNLISILMLF